MATLTLQSNTGHGIDLDSITFQDFADLELTSGATQEARLHSAAGAPEVIDVVERGTGFFYLNQKLVAGFVQDITWTQTTPSGTWGFTLTDGQIDLSQSLSFFQMPDARMWTVPLRHADSITGTAYADTIPGYGWGDTIFGGAGDDHIYGNDQSGQHGDISGPDLAVLTAKENNYLRGEEGNDVIVGAWGFDDINGNMGNDTAHGMDGDDWVVGGKDQDMLFGDDGGDIVYGNLGDDTCDGGNGADLVRGGQGNDVITGGAGADWLSGDRGNDTLTGGAGADVFHGSQDAGIDRITDFNLAEGDSIRLDPGTTYTLSQVGADTVLDMGGANQMILVGVTLSAEVRAAIFVG